MSVAKRVNVVMLVNCEKCGKPIMDVAVKHRKKREHSKYFHPDCWGKK